MCIKSVKYVSICHGLKYTINFCIRNIYLYNNIMFNLTVLHICVGACYKPEGHGSQ
jgi:hypothetical protein